MHSLQYHSMTKTRRSTAARRQSHSTVGMNLSSPKNLAVVTSHQKSTALLNYVHYYDGMNLAISTFSPPLADLTREGSPYRETAFINLSNTVAIFIYEAWRQMDFL